MVPRRKPVIYVVDDDEAVRDSTHLLLETYGFETRSYSSARQFLDDFDATAAGCIIIDLHMPGISGLKLLEMLRSGNMIIPVIAFSGRADAELDVLVKRGGAVALLAKPIDNDDLIGLVNQVLSTPR